MASLPGLRDRVEAVEKLAHLFKVERFVYLGVTAISFLTLFAVAVRIFVHGGTQLAEWGLLFGSSGLITITGNQVLRMWNQALRVVASEPVGGDSGVSHG